MASLKDKRKCQKTIMHHLIRAKFKMFKRFQGNEKFKVSYEEKIYIKTI